jgi:hypothetical protein
LTLFDNWVKGVFMRGLKRKKDLKRLKRRIERLIFEEKFF